MLAKGVRKFLFVRDHLEQCERLLENRGSPAGLELHLTPPKAASADKQPLPTPATLQ